MSLLAGRAYQRQLFPLVSEELGARFSLNNALQYGTLPIVVQSKSPAETLQVYAQLYATQEIQAEAAARQLPGFLRFLPIAALFHRHALNLSGLAQDAMVPRSTLDGHIQVLEDSLLIARLAAFEPKLRVKERKHPKFYWTDIGIVRALRQELGGTERRVPRTFI